MNEFGKSYGVQILDIADRQYSYHIGMYLNSNGSCGFKLLHIGRSNFVEGWKGDYNLFTKNRQHFARALQIYLTNDLFN